MTPSASYLTFRTSRESHWNDLAESYNHRGLKTGYYRRLAELYRNSIPVGHSVLEIGCGKGDLLAALEPSRGVGVDFSAAMLDYARAAHPTFRFIHADAHDLGAIQEQFDFIVFSDLIDDLYDVQGFLQQIRPLCLPSTRIVFNFFSHLWSMPLRLAQSLGIATTMLPQNWLTVEDMEGLLRLAGFELVSHNREILLPVEVPVLSTLFNRVLAKVKPVSHLDLTHLIVARPVAFPSVPTPLPTVSVIVPACNEAGNIAEIFDRVPSMGSGTELVFVEGGSTDNTYEVIEAEIQRRSSNCRLFKQPGTGKGDAVRYGFEHASGDILVILDADLTVAPEDLPKFYSALVNGVGEFINGVRLVYPMNGKAMQFSNLIGNKFFSMAFTWLFGQTVKDTLCGTKALWRTSYSAIASQRRYFGELDPFGDFDLLLGAVRQNLRIVDLPVRYGERTYGTTNIQRWSHGLLLLRMLGVAARKLKFI